MCSYNYSRAAREQRQAAWQRGHDYATTRHLVDAALGVGNIYVGPDEQYYYLLGIADTIYAAGRDLAGLDQRSTPIEGSRKR